MRHELLMAAILAGAITAAGGSAAGADPVTYSGTLGRSPIVVEFTDDPTAAGAAPSARYFYLAHGIDIPLHGKSGRNGFEMDEEEACGTEKCANGEAPPVAATWRLYVAGDGSLEGTWTGKRAFPLRLTRVASRPQPDDLPRTPHGLYTFSDRVNHPGGDGLTMENSPYDYLRLDVPPVEGEPAGWPGATYRYVVDPRTKFPMPRVVDLGDGVSTDAANRVLRDRHWRASRAALSCAALRYRGFSESDRPGFWEDGSLAGFDESQSAVLFLTPSLMSWQESGSLYCGGAHPHNYRDQYVMEVATGRLLGLGDMFADVVDGAPGDTLAAFVIETRGEPDDPIQADYERECGTEDLIRTNLAAHLRREGDAAVLVFGLAGLGHAMGACADDVLEVPAEDAKALFRPEFRRLLAP